MVTTAKQRSQGRTMLILLSLVGIIAGYLFYTQTIKNQPIDIPPLAIREQDELSEFENFNLDFSAFDNLSYKSLRIFGEAPVLPGVTGRPNMFAPY